MVLENTHLKQDCDNLEIELHAAEDERIQERRSQTPMTAGGGATGTIGMSGGRSMAIQSPRSPRVVGTLGGGGGGGTTPRSASRRFTEF